MYQEYFGFKELPFSIAPDPHYLYMTAQHREALAHLVYGLNSEGGCILLTGEVGTGKTTICRCMLEQIPEQANIALLLNPKVTAIELLETICDEFKIQYPTTDFSKQENTVKTYIDLINTFLLEANAKGEKTVLIIDEAQNLDSTVLEQLRLLTNLETNQRKLLQIVILGQPELIDILSRKEMRQLAQRITARFHLKPLSKNEIKAYITHRLAIAGQNVQLFPNDVISKIYQISKGIPRLINVICDRALLGAYVQNKHRVDKATVNQAAKEIFGEIKNRPNQYSKQQHQKRLLSIAATLSLISITAVITYNFLSQPKAIKNVTEAFNTPPSEESVSKIAVNKKVDAALAIVSSINEDTQIAMTENNNSNDKNKEAVSASYVDAINTLILNSSDNKANAYKYLFSLWGKPYDSKINGNECTHASKHGLSCLHRSGNLHSLRRLNRPAVIKIYSPKGVNTYAAITHLDDNLATISNGTNEITIDTDTLNSHWFGEYTLLWQKPPFYKSAVMPGNNGPIVQWLDQQLVRIYGQSETPTISDTYSNNLVTQVKTFQQHKGLFPDGIAGPRTLIHLNNEIGLQAPKLIPQNNTRKS